EIHEVTPNPQSECLAEDAPAAVAQPDTPACATCACAATASAKSAAAPTGTRAKIPAAAEPAVTVAMKSTPAAVAPARPVVSARAERELQRLMDGNKRFVEGEADNDGWSCALRGETAPL